MRGVTNWQIVVVIKPRRVIVVVTAWCAKPSLASLLVASMILFGLKIGRRRRELLLSVLRTGLTFFLVPIKMKILSRWGRLLTFKRRVNRRTRRRENLCLIVTRFFGSRGRGRGVGARWWVARRGRQSGLARRPVSWRRRVRVRRVRVGRLLINRRGRFRQS